MIEATYIVSEADFIEAQRAWCSREVKKLPGRVLVQAVGVIFGGFVGASFRYIPLWLMIALSVSLLTSVCVTQWRKKALRRYQYSLRVHHLQAVNITIDEDGYRDETRGECSKWMSWNHFNGWLETPRIFVLGLNLSFVVMPKEAFSVNQQEELRSLLILRIDPSKRLPTAS